MKTGLKELLGAIYLALNGNITHKAAIVPVYSSVPFDADFPYIYIGSTTSANTSVKDTDIEDITLVMDVVTGFSGGGSKIDCLEISNSMANLIDTTNLNLGPSYKIIIKTNEGVETLDLKTESNQIFRALSRWRFKIEAI